jgi:FMN phosphatase YigB (HAD superfamily)
MAAQVSADSTDISDANHTRRESRPETDAFLAAALNACVASFDVFDTALWRRVAQPTHLFALVEQKLGARFSADIAAGFAQARVNAEMAARDLGRTGYGFVEVTFDEIYAALPGVWPRPKEVLAFARGAEIAAELEVVDAEPAMLDVYRRLKQAGITTIFVSDVYLDEADVRALLVTCGYDPADPLYVSSRHRRAKWDGSMWDLVTEREGVSMGEIAHIGDNPRVDVEVAREAGIQAFPWPGRSRHHKSHAPVSPAILPLSVLKARGQSPTQPDDASFWPQLGRSYGTLIFGSFLAWLSEQTRNGIDHVYFCSRDGQVMFDLWRELVAPRGEVPSASYLHVSRRSLMLTRLDRLNAAAIDFLCSGLEQRSVRGYLERASLLGSPAAVARAETHFGSLDAIPDPEALEPFFRASARELAAVAHRHRDLTDAYLRQEGLFEGGRRVLVDLGWRGTLQRSVAEAIKRHGAPTLLSGLYYGLTRDAGVNRGSAGWMAGMIANDFSDDLTDRQLRQMVTILEQVHAADHGSVAGYAHEGERVVPVLQPSPVEEAQYRAKIRPFQEAAAAELRLIYAGAHDLAPADLTPRGAWAALEDLCLYPSSEEARRVGSLRFLDGFEHSGEGLPLAATLPTGALDEAEAALLSHTWTPAALRNWREDHPALRSHLHALALAQRFDPRWASQFP